MISMSVGPWLGKFAVKKKPHLLVGLAIGPVSETAKNVHEALGKARQMYETGLVNVSIKDEGGHKIDGDDLLAAITGKKTITDDLRAE